MSDWEPLNRPLYDALRQTFGKVKVDKAGHKMARRVNATTGDVEILSKGETYRVCCDECGDSKHKLYVNYAFGTTDPQTGQTYLFNNCYRCGPKTGRLMSLITWNSMRKVTATPLADEDEIEDIPLYLSPGECLRLDDPRTEIGRKYLAHRGIDPDLAARTYGVSLCVRGNPEVCNGGIEGRLVFPVTKDGVHLGWQARLAHEPNEFERDRTFKGLRWFTMPGEWRSKHLFGYDQARSYPFCVLVEGPTDLVKQGPPCIASLGQTVSYDQVRLIKATWKTVILVGDSQKNESGTENEAQRRTAKMLLSEGVERVHLVRLPHGDPGDWGRLEFWQFLRQSIAANPKGLGGDQSIGSLMGHGGV